jgi:uncharacterized protein
MLKSPEFWMLVLVRVVMRPIYIPELLNAPQQTRVLEIQEPVADLASLTPVQGKLQVSHCGNYLQVTAKVETIVTLCCDRCLQQFNHRLVCDTAEMIWLREPAENLPDELEVEFDDLIESLSPVGYFDPQDWLYQQLQLALPQRQLCDRQCQGLTSQINANTTPVDRRWAALAALQQNLLNGQTED